MERRKENGKKEDKTWAGGAPTQMQGLEVTRLACWAWKGATQ